MWHPVSTAPFDHDLELAIIDSNGVHAIAVPCRRIIGDWMVGIKTRIAFPPLARLVYRRLTLSGPPRRTNVRFWHKADMQEPLSNVRYWG